MNRKTFVNSIIDWAKEFNLDLNELLVSHGGAMLLMGLRDETGDVDLHVTPKVWDRFALSKNVEYLGDGVYLISVTPDIDIHIGGYVNSDFKKSEVSPEGIRYRSRNDTLEDYIKLDREKDAASIKKLKEEES